MQNLKIGELKKMGIVDGSTNIHVEVKGSTVFHGSFDKLDAQHKKLEIKFIQILGLTAYIEAE